MCNYNYKFEELKLNLNTFRNTLREKLKEQKLTLSSLASLSDLSEDTLRSIIYGKSQDIKLSTLIKIADVLQCSIDELVNRTAYSDEELQLFERIHNLPEYSVQVIQVMVNMEERYLLQKSVNGTEIIPLLLPKGNFRDGMYYDGNLFESLNITNYPAQLKKEISFGLKISTSYYEPLYFPNDILLMSTKNYPVFNDIVLYIDSVGKIYIRRYTELGLEPLVRFDDLIPIYEAHNYTALGVLVKTVKEFDIEQYR